MRSGQAVFVGSLSPERLWTGFIGGSHQVTQTRMSQVVTESVLSPSYMGS